MTVHKKPGERISGCCYADGRRPAHVFKPEAAVHSSDQSQKMLMLIGPQNYFYRMVKSGDMNERRTALKQRIKMYGELNV